MILPVTKFFSALPDIRLEGERVILRPPGVEDWPAWAAVREKNRDFLKPFEPAWPKNCLSRDFFIRRLRRQKADWDRGVANYFLIFNKDNSALMGGININDIHRGIAQFASLGYWIDRDFQGRDYMAEAMGCVIRYTFTELKLHRLQAGCLLHNERSRRLLLGAGFRKEGRAEKYLKIDGKWQDHDLFGLPVERWRQAMKKAAAAR